MYLRTIPRSIGFIASRQFHCAPIVLRKAAEETKVKRPGNAFAMFVKDVFTDVKMANSGAELGEVSKLIAQQWNALEESARAKYRDRATEAFKVYQQERPPVRPKRAPSAFTFYQREQFKKLADTGSAVGGKFEEVARGVAKGWADLSTDARQKYEKLAEEAKAEFDRDYPKPVKQLKRGITGYAMFYKEKCKELKKQPGAGPMKVGAASKEVSAQWAKLDESAQQKYKQLADKFNKERM